jgi:hypothetical protein
LSAGREYCCKTGEPVNCLSLWCWRRDGKSI